MPYYVSGGVKEQKDLKSTPVGVMCDPSFFQKGLKRQGITRTSRIPNERGYDAIRRLFLIEMAKVSVDLK